MKLLKANAYLEIAVGSHEILKPARGNASKQTHSAANHIIHPFDIHHPSASQNPSNHPQKLLAYVTMLEWLSTTAGGPEGKGIRVGAKHA